MIETISSLRRVASDLSDLHPPQTLGGPLSVCDKVFSPPNREGRKRPSSLSSLIPPSSSSPAACKMRQRHSTGLSTSKKRSPLVDRPIVDHTYVDHFHDPEVCSEHDSEKKFTARGGVTIPFPEKLHAMLSSIEEDYVVGWQPHGRAFSIRAKDKFVNEIMPK